LCGFITHAWRSAFYAAPQSPFLQPTAGVTGKMTLQTALNRLAG